MTSGESAAGSLLLQLTPSSFPRSPLGPLLREALSDHPTPPRLGQVLAAGLPQPILTTLGLSSVDHEPDENRTGTALGWFLNDTPTASCVRRS